MNDPSDNNAADLPLLMRRRTFLQAAGLGVATTCLTTTRAIYPRQSLDYKTIAEQAQQRRQGRDVLLRLLIPQGSRANVIPVCRQFEKDSGVKFTIREVGVDNISTDILMRSATGDAGFDVGLPATFAIQDLVASNALLNFSDLANRYEPKSFAQGRLYSLGDFVGGQRYGYQADGDVYMVFYNQRLLDDPMENARFESQHGYPLGVAKTWDELDAMMKFFHRPDKGVFGGTLFRTPDYMLWEWWARLHSLGSYPLDDNAAPLIDGPEGLQALKDLMKASKWQYPDAAAHDLFKNWEFFREGRSFCCLGWGGTQKALSAPESKVKGRITFGLLPGGRFGETTVPMPYFNWGWNYVVSSSSKHSELAYLFALYASCRKPSTWAVREADGFFDPHLSTHYSDPGIIKTYGSEFLAVHEQGMKLSMPDFYIRGQARYFDILHRYLAYANQGKMTAEAALSTSAKAWSNLTRRYGQEQQAAEWKRLRARYPEAIRNALA